MNYASAPPLPPQYVMPSSFPAATYHATAGTSGVSAAPKAYGGNSGSEFAPSNPGAANVTPVAQYRVAPAVAALPTGNVYERTAPAGPAAGPPSHNRHPAEPAAGSASLASFQEPSAANPAAAAPSAASPAQPMRLSDFM